METGAGSGGSTTYQPDLGDYDDSGEGYDEYGDADPYATDSYASPPPVKPAEQSVRSKFLFESMQRIQKRSVEESNKVKIAVAGELYSVCLKVAFDDRSDGAQEAAVELIESRRSGKLNVRRRDEAMAVRAERMWEERLGRRFVSEWDGVKLFDQSEL